jgi:hypothetical protein
MVIFDIDNRSRRVCSQPAQKHMICVRAKSAIEKCLIL